MKKLASTSLIILTLLSLTACGNKWYQPDPNMPDEYREHEEESLKENLSKLDEEGFGIETALEVAINYQFLGDYKKAIDYYEQILDADVNHKVALNNIADIYEEVGEYETAAEYIKRLYAISQDNEETIKDTVRILLEADDYLNAQHALDNYASIVMADPESEYYEYDSEVVGGLQEQINDYMDAQKQ